MATTLSTPNYFATSHVSGDLTAPSGNNGVYAYGGAGLFPTNSFNSSSYGVDVVFNPAKSEINRLKPMPTVDSLLVRMARSR